MVLDLSYDSRNQVLDSQLKVARQKPRLFCSRFVNPFYHSPLFVSSPVEIYAMSSTVDWYYHRKGCVTCQKMDALLASIEITAKEVVSATKTRLGVPEALELIGPCTRLVVSKGTKHFDIDLKKTPQTSEQLQALLIGPTGNLRAPTIRKGKTLYVGFHAETFAAALVGK